MAKPKNLQNHFLVTMPHLTESLFGKGIIYLCEHNKDGAMGIMLNKPIPIYGKGDNIRDWIYVEDHCDAIFEVIKNALPGEKYNIGSNLELTNIEIVTILCRLMDEYFPSNLKKSYMDLVEFVEDRPGHDFRYSLNIDKITENLNWKPSKDINEGLEDTVKWYIDNEKWWSEILKLKKDTQ